MTLKKDKDTLYLVSCTGVPKLNDVKKDKDTLYLVSCSWVPKLNDVKKRQRYPVSSFVHRST
jgi:hypothetical protein